MPLYEREIALYRRSLGPPGPPRSTAPTHAGLTGIVYGNAGLRSPRGVDSVTTFQLAWSPDDARG